MNLTEIRKQYPQYDGIDDATLAEGLHKRYYSDMSFEEFSGKIGYNPNVGRESGPADTSLADIGFVEEQVKTPPEPEKEYEPLTLGRIAKVPWEAAKRFIHGKAVSLRSYTKTLADIELTPENMDHYNYYLHSFERTQINWRMKELMAADEAMTEDDARFNAMKEVIEKRHERTIETMKKIENAPFLQYDPDFMHGKSSGTFEETLLAVFQSAPDMLIQMANPVIGVVSMFSTMQGLSYEGLEQAGTEQDEALAAQLASQGLSDEEIIDRVWLSGPSMPHKRAMTASSVSAAIQTPLEALGNVFKIKGITGSGKFAQRVLQLVESGGGELITEFPQEFPDQIATMWAMNPDLKPVEFVNFVSENMHNVIGDATHSGMVGAFAGLGTAGVGQITLASIDRMVSGKQKRINEQKFGRLKELFNTENPTAEDKAEVCKIVGINPEIVEDKEIDQIVQNIKNRVLFQSGPIESEAREHVRQQFIKTGKYTENEVDFHMSLWDGIARVAAEQGVPGVGKDPGTFYEKWLSDVQTSTFQEFQQQVAGQPVEALFQEGGPVEPKQGSVLEVITKPDAAFKEVDAEKRKIKSQIVDNVKSGGFEVGGAVRFGTVDELLEMLKSNKVMLSQEYDESHATPIVSKDDDMFAAYGAYDKHSMAFYVPKEFVREKPDAHTKEVVVDPNADIKSFQFMIDGHDKVYTYNDLVDEIKKSVKSSRVAYQTVAYQKNDVKHGAVQYLFDNTPKIIHAFEAANASTPIHETGHILLEMMYRAKSLDYLELAKWAGVEPESMQQGTEAWEIEQLEKVAKAFELYVMEGRAPTSRLQIVFNRMKQWMISIYKSAANRYFGDVKINDNVRAVFDRWVATEAERQFDPVRAADELISSVSDEQTQRQPGTLPEYEDLLSEARNTVLKELSRGRMAKEKKLKKQLYAAATAEISANPHYEMLDGIKKVGISNEKLSELFDKNIVDEIKKKLPGIVRADGRDPAEISGRFGYDDAESMINDMMDRPGREAAIEQTFDVLWREYKKTLDIENANALSDVFETEINILYEMLGKKRPKTKRSIKNIIREQTGQIKTQEYKDLVADMKRDEKLARNAYSEGLRAAKDAEQEKANGKLSDQSVALRDKYLSEVIKLKEAQKERINRMRELKKQQAEKEKIHRRMNRYIRHSSMLPQYKRQINYLLGQYYHIPKTWTTDLPEQTLDAFLAEREESDSYVVATAMQLKEILPPPKSKGKLDFDDLKNIASLCDTLAQMERLDRNQKLIDEKKAINDVVDKIAERAYSVHGHPDTPKHPLEAGRRPTWFENMSEGSKAFFAELRKSEFLLKQLDGWEDFGPAWEAIFQPIKEAEDAELKLGTEIMEQLAGAFGKFKNNRKWANKKRRIPGLSFDVTTEQLIMIALNSGNKGNREALVVGSEIKKEQIESAFGMLTKEERQLVFDIWEIIDSLFPQLNEVHKKLTGSDLKKVDGFYFPLVFDKRLSWTAGKHAAKKELRDMFSNEYIRPKVEAGHRIERKGGKLPVDLHFPVIQKHILKVIHDITHQIPVRNAQKVISNPSFREICVGTIGKENYKQLTPWLQEVASPRQEPASKLENVWGHIRRSTTTAALGVKFSVAAKQTLSLTQTMNAVGVGRTLSAMQRFYRNPWRMRDFVKERSVAMANRRKVWDRELSQFFNKFNPREFKYWEFAKEAFFSMISFMDSVATYPTWLAGYELGLEKFDYNEDKAIAYADQLVRTTQPAASPKDVAAIQRGGELKKLFTMFYTFFSVFHNNMADLHAQRRVGRVDMVDMIKSYWLLLVMPAILGGIIQRREIDPKEMIKDVILYGVAGMPFVRDLTSAALSDYTATMSPSAGIIQEFDRLGKNLRAEEIDPQKLIKRGIMISGYAAGLPSSQAVVTMEGIIDMIEGKTKNPIRLLLREKKEK